MLIEWKDLDLPYIKRLLHIGGHLAEEAEIYKDNVGEVVWVEADGKRAQKMRELTGDTVICAVVSDRRKIVTFHEANNGQSSSILKLGTHKTAHPEVEYIAEHQVQSIPMSEIIEQRQLGAFDMINIDIQGAELLALDGMGSHLDSVNYIYTEVNEEPLYEGCCLIGQLDNFLSDFTRTKTRMTSFGWGDALYVRNGH